MKSFDELRLIIEAIDIELDIEYLGTISDERSLYFDGDWDGKVSVLTFQLSKTKTLGSRVERHRFIIIRAILRDQRHINHTKSTIKRSKF